MHLKENIPSYISSFFQYLEFEKRYSKHTLIAYEDDVASFLLFLDQNYAPWKLELIDHQIIRTWIVELSDKELGARSITRKLACLRSLFKFLFQRKWIATNPMLLVKSPKIEKRLPIFIEENEITQLFEKDFFASDFQGIRDKLLLELLYGTGLRLSEIIDLNHANFLYNFYEMSVLGKGGKQRLVPIHSQLKDRLHEYLNAKKLEYECNSNSPFLVTDKGKQLYPMFVYRKVKEYLTLISTQEKKSPHVLRHTFATHLLNKGADLNAIKDLLGHSSLAATQVYTHNSMEKLKKIFEQAHPRA